MTALRQVVRAGLSCTKAAQTLSVSRGYATGKGFSQAALAQTYLRDYAKAKQSGQANVALEVLDKARVAAEFVHVPLPIQASGTEELVPLIALMPNFRDALNSPFSMLPVVIDDRKKVIEPPMKKLLEEINRKGPAEPRAIIVTH